MIFEQRNRILRRRARRALTAMLLATAISAAGSCLQFQASDLDSTGVAVVLPAIFGATLFTISGTLRDPDGAIVSGSTLTITPRSGGAATSTVTDSNGDFSTPLRAGTYDIAFSFNSKALDLALTVNNAGGSTSTSNTGVYYLAATRTESFIAVAVGQNGSNCKTWYSTDLTNWTANPMPGNLASCMAVRDIVYANGVFVAVGATGPSRCYTAYSTDGINWTQTNCPVGSGSSGLFSVAYGNGLFAAVGQYDSVKPTLRVSADNGRNWSEISPGIGSLDWGAIVYNGQKFFVSESSGSAASQVYESPNPNLTSFTATGVGCANSAAALMLKSVKGPGFKFALATDLAGEGVIYFNGSACSTATAFSGQEGNIEGITYNPLDNRYAMIGLNCGVDVSMDGTTWSGSSAVNVSGCAPTIQLRDIQYSAVRREFIVMGRQTTSFLPQVLRSSSGLGGSFTVNSLGSAGSVNDDPRALAIRE